MLRDFSNPDKHERLTHVEAKTTAGMTISGRRIDTRTGVVSERIVAMTPEGPAAITEEKAVAVLFADNSPVLETLDSLRDNVAKVLESFAPAFR
ncbi:MAG: hypothetical protein ACJ8IR_06635 [Alphaproteobacteria bacterium]|jgi:hypothetical protein